MMGLGVGQGLFDAGPSTGNHIQHRFVQKVLEDPDQDQEINDLEYKSGPVQLHGVIPQLRIVTIAFVFKYMPTSIDIQVVDCGTTR